VEAESYL
jgi:hypothetical protein